MQTNKLQTNMNKSTVAHDANDIKSTKRVQTSAEAAYYSHIARIPDLASQHGDTDRYRL